MVKLTKRKEMVLIFNRCLSQAAGAFNGFSRAGLTSSILLPYLYPILFKLCGSLSSVFFFPAASIKVSFYSLRIVAFQM